jgi:hypothetical protein
LSGETAATPRADEPAGSLLPRLGLVLAAIAVTGGILHLLGVGGYRSGFFGVFLPLALVAGAATWFGLGPRAGRGSWTVAGVIVAVTVAGLLVSAAPVSRGRLLADARSLLPPFHEEVSAQTSGHSWCRPECPSATLLVAPPETGAPAVMVEIATPFFARGLLTERQLAAISRQREFEVHAPDRTYRVALEGEGDDRRLRIVVASA